MRSSGRPYRFIRDRLQGDPHDQDRHHPGRRCTPEHFLSFHAHRHSSLRGIRGIYICSAWLYDQQGYSEISSHRGTSGPARGGGWFRSAARGRARSYSGSVTTHAGRGGVSTGTPPAAARGLRGPREAHHRAEGWPNPSLACRYGLCPSTNETARLMWGKARVSGCTGCRGRRFRAPASSGRT